MQFDQSTRDVGGIVVVHLEGFPVIKGAFPAYAFADQFDAETFAGAAQFESEAFKQTEGVGIITHPGRGLFSEARAHWLWLRGR